MNKLLLTLLMALSMFGLNSFAQYEFGKTPDIHVEGKQLVDAKGHPVRFFGFMDTPSCWFNGGKWGWSYDTNGETRCKEYFDKLFTATTDTVAGTYCNLFRLHLEPAWLGGDTYCPFCGKTVTLYTQEQIDKTPSYAYCKYCYNPVFRKGKNSKGEDVIIDPDGQEVSGEADTHSRSMTKLKNYMNSVYMPIAEDANKHGMYVIMRPPGVCPGTIRVGGYYQKYLINCWDVVTQNAKVKAAKGWLSIELANEPVRIVDENGASSATAMRDFFQPVVDKIRENGFEGVVWVAGTGWQASYADYKTYPIQDANFGYAVHNYTGWYGGSDESYSQGRTVSQYINQFHNQVPVMDTNPIVITEVDWSPEKPSAAGTGHVNEHGEWVDGNYGTWATGSTSKWGVLYKGLMDQNDNISMTLSSTGCYLDVDAYVDNDKKEIVPAFKRKMEADGKDPYEASGVACWQWYKDYYYQQHNNYSDKNISISSINTTSISNVTVSPGFGKYIKINATFESGRKTDIQASCTYKVADPTVARVFMGEVIGLAAGETDITATYTDVTGKAYDLTFHVIVNNNDIAARSVSNVKDIVLAPSGRSTLDITATMVSGRKVSVQNDCTYKVENTKIAKVVYGKVVALAVGETDIVATYTDGTGESFEIPFHVSVTYFPLTKDGFNPAVQGSGSIKNATATTLSYSCAKGGMGGWTYGTPISIGAYDTLTVKIVKNTAAKPVLRFYDSADLTAVCAEVSLTDAETKIALKDLKKTNGKTLARTKIYAVCFYTAAASTLYIRSLELSKADADAIEEVAEDVVADNKWLIYDLNGVKRNQTQKGVNIIRDANGKTKKVLVK